jgi:hypothetical protein
MEEPSRLASADLENFLQSLQTADVESIELITQPSSKYILKELLELYQVEENKV